jgi:soluble cytochrome b562
MSKITQDMRKAVDSAIDALQMVNFTEGFTSAIDGLDELSNIKHNEGDLQAAEVLIWAAKELRGENC